MFICNTGLSFSLSYIKDSDTQSGSCDVPVAVNYAVAYPVRDQVAAPNPLHRHFWRCQNCSELFFGV